MIGPRRPSITSAETSRRICFDGLNLVKTRGTGVATYTKLLVNLARSHGIDTAVLYASARKLSGNPVLREIQFFDSPPQRRPPWWRGALHDVEDIIHCTVGVKPVAVPLTGAVLTQQIASRWPQPDRVYSSRNLFNHANTFFKATHKPVTVTFPDKIDIFHWTYPLPLHAKGAANIFTLHDIVPLRLPYTTLDQKSYYHRLLRDIVRRADHIVTVSENSKRDILSFFPEVENRITNTYQAIDIPPVIRNKTDEEVEQVVGGVLGLKLRGYLLFFGAIEPKKNLERLLQSYLSAKAGMPLVVVAAPAWGGEAEISLIDQDRSKGRKRSIHRLEYLPFQLLMTLVKGARAVLFPSLYEGFGLPVLEAMALGAPVVTSTTSSLPEVAGDAAIMVDPYDVDALRDAIRTVAFDDDKCAEMTREGLIQATKFSKEAYWERMERLYGSFM